MHEADTQWSQNKLSRCLRLTKYFRRRTYNFHENHIVSKLISFNESILKLRIFHPSGHYGSLFHWYKSKWTKGLTFENGIESLNERRAHNFHRHIHRTNIVSHKLIVNPCKISVACRLPWRDILRSLLWYLILINPESILTLCR